jgi:hypothetical protein
VYSGLNAVKRDTGSDDSDDNDDNDNNDNNGNSSSHQHQRDNNGGQRCRTAFMSSMDEGLGFLWSSRRPWCDAVAETIHE